MGRGNGTARTEAGDALSPIKSSTQMEDWKLKSPTVEANSLTLIYRSLMSLGRAFPPTPHHLGDLFGDRSTRLLM